MWSHFKLNTMTISTLWELKALFANYIVLFNSVNNNSTINNLTTKFIALVDTDRNVSTCSDLKQCLESAKQKYNTVDKIGHLTNPHMNEFPYILRCRCKASYDLCEDISLYKWIIWDGIVYGGNKSLVDNDACGQNVYWIIKALGSKDMH